MLKICSLCALVALAAAVDGRDQGAFVGPAAPVGSGVLRRGLTRRPATEELTDFDLIASRNPDKYPKEMSKSIPFMPRPYRLDGTMAADDGFDPFGFSNWLDLRWAREAEIKHGRLCMLATVGYIFAEYFKLPGEVHQVSSLEAHNKAVEYGAMSQILLWISFAEIFSTIAVVQMYDGSGRQPGEFGFDPLGFCKNKSPEFVKDMQKKEIKNGRLAMLAISGILTQAALTNKGFPYF
ncbi:unnamed protein product [Vitrella brassicaformis CCMP3155]|uniref:Plastid light harvesting protein n=2 Tax=Vitrella brassicaformis TaxID=1169539 RepID=A0A0G4FMW2_VITBC|nr:unnamed protein product [Vitrella brassicaformis CCMP3155]|eukprot:CEM15583.1 unnamed protein product [Vitrella brassicaformis CCMP3155]